MSSTSRRLALTGAIAAALGVGLYAELLGRRDAALERARAQTAGLGRWRATAPPREAPALAFVDADGRARTLAEWRGRVVLLNLWATWCAPCLEEMPALDRLQARLGGGGFEVVALAMDRQGATLVRPFFTKLGLARLALYLDASGAATRAVGARGLPTSLLLDRAGRELGRVEGAADWDGAALDRVVRAAIAAPGAKG
jgi:thiol-disulfide isomerase/thioredoxin